MSTDARLVPLGDRAPVGVQEVELAGPLTDLAPAAGEEPWTVVVVVVRLHTVPLGMFVADLDDGRLTVDRLLDLVDRVLGEDVRAHLAQDGLPPDALRTPLDDAPCQQARRATLADAPGLSVVIPTRDRAATLARCLDSVLRCTYPLDRLELVVVDNVPTDGSTRAVVDELAARGVPVRYARCDAPGSASARNAGLEVVSHELVVFTDDDSFPDTWWLAEIAAAFLAAPEAAAVTGMLLPRELETQAQLWFEQYGGFSRGFSRRVFTVDRSSDPGNPLYPYAAGIYGTGNNMAFRRSALRRAGDFDPALGNGTPALGGVDSEVLLRTVLTGGVLVYEPRAVVWHSHRRDVDGLRRQIYAYGSGLTAYMLKTVLHNPHLLPDFARRVPVGLRFALSSSSDKNARKTHDYPDDLTKAELRGMLHGVMAYARSRRAYGRHASPKAVRPR